MQKGWGSLVFVLLLLASCNGSAQGVQEQALAGSLVVESPRVVLSGVPFDLALSARLASGEVDTSYCGTPRVEGLALRVDGREQAITQTPAFVRGRLELRGVLIKGVGRREIVFTDGALLARTAVRVMPGVVSLLPPVLAIVLAVAARQVLIALFCGIWLGSTFVWDFNPFTGLLRAVDTYLIRALADADHVAVVMFSMILGGMVGVISKSGGMQGVVDRISRHARGPRGGQLATWAMGLLVFFDDYANTLLVGNTMRPLTDRLRISREKLSYVVDATAAPVASIAFISTWVGFQVGLIDSAFEGLGFERDAYLVFLRSIPVSTYSVLTILFVFLVGLTLRDFGAMYRAEHRSAATGRVLREGAQPLSDASALDADVPEHVPRRWCNAMVPIVTVITVVVAGLYYSGRSEIGPTAETARLGEIVGAADSFKVLMWASISGAAMAIALAVAQRVLALTEALQAWLNGVKAMVLAMLILVLAWSIGDVCRHLGTADYVVCLSSRILSPHLIPLVTFLVAAFVSFSTGTSWATMAILTPIVVTIAYKLPLEHGIDRNCLTP